MLQIFLMDIKQHYRIHHPEFDISRYSSDDIVHHYLNMEIHYRLIKTLTVLQMDFNVRNTNHDELPPINVFGYNLEKYSMKKEKLYLYCYIK